MPRSGHLRVEALGEAAHDRVPEVDLGAEAGIRLGGCDDTGRAGAVGDDRYSVRRDRADRHSRVRLGLEADALADVDQASGDAGGPGIAPDAHKPRVQARTV